MICLANKYNIKSYVESDDSPSRISAELSLVYIYSSPELCAVTYYTSMPRRAKRPALARCTGNSAQARQSSRRPRTCQPCILGSWYRIEQLSNNTYG